MICDTCLKKHKCSEYQANGVSEKSHYEWIQKSEKCEDTEDEFHARANRLAEPVYIKGWDY